MNAKIRFALLFQMFLFLLSLPLGADAKSDLTRRARGIYEITSLSENAVKYAFSGYRAGQPLVIRRPNKHHAATVHVRDGNTYRLIGQAAVGQGTISIDPSFYQGAPVGFKILENRSSTEFVLYDGNIKNLGGCFNIPAVWCRDAAIKITNYTNVPLVVEGRSEKGVTFETLGTYTLQPMESHRFEGFSNNVVDTEIIGHFTDKSGFDNTFQLFWSNCEVCTPHARGNFDGQGIDQGLDEGEALRVDDHGWEFWARREADSDQFKELNVIIGVPSKATVIQAEPPIPVP